MGYVVVAVLFILAMIGLTRPYIGLLALLIVMELQPGELYPQTASLHLERVVAGILVIGFLLNGKKFRFPTPTKWFLAFFGAMVISIPLAYWRGNAVASCIGFMETVVFVLFVTALLTTENRIRWFVLTDILLVDWLGGSALWNYSHGIWQVRMHIERAVGITSSAGDPDTMAITLLLAIPLSLAMLARSNPMWMRVVAAVSIVVYLVTIVYTGSRAAAAGVLFLLLLLLFRKPKNLVYLPILIGLAPLVWVVIPQQYKARYETVNHLKDDASYQNRILSWEGGIAMFVSNPITGVGAGNYTYANGMQFWPGSGRKHWLNAHSLYFKVLGELGLIGIITFGGYLVCVFRLNFRLKRELQERNASAFLQQLPSMFNLMYCVLLFDGYAAHNLYRDAWYFVGAITASMSLLPMLTDPVKETAAGQIEGRAPASVEGEWSPALLPVLRKQIPTLSPPA